MNRLKELRLEKGLLQSDIAKKINKSDRAVGLYERGERDIGTETLAILSDFFNVSIDYLLGKSDIRNPEKIDEGKVNVAFSSGFSGLNDTNKEIINSTIAGLLAKQEMDDKKKK